MWMRKQESVASSGYAIAKKAERFYRSLVGKQVRGGNGRTW